jgi:hypothetical protein
MFAAYAGSLPTSDIYDIVTHAEPLSDFVRYRYPANLRLRYERLTRFPAGYLVFGDALCSFNPVYGQGMTVAAQEAALLRECLDAGDADLARRVFAAASTAIDTPWDIAVGNDLRHPQVAGPRSRSAPTKLLQPAIVTRVLRGNFSRRHGNTEAAPAGIRA